MIQVYTCEGCGKEFEDDIKMVKIFGRPQRDISVFGFCSEECRGEFRDRVVEYAKSLVKVEAKV